MLNPDLLAAKLIDALNLASTKTENPVEAQEVWAKAVADAITVYIKTATVTVVAGQVVTVTAPTAGVGVTSSPGNGTLS